MIAWALIMWAGAYQGYYVIQDLADRPACEELYSRLKERNYAPWNFGNHICIEYRKAP